VAKQSTAFPGDQYGDLTVLEKLSGPKRLCRCSCGNILPAFLSNLTRGRTTSCGCKRGDNISKNRRSHGDTDSDEYRIWSWMRGRCNNPRNPKYNRYGGRGISIDPKWESYEAFLSDMGRRPTKTHSINRIDNDGDYTPSNCVWSTPKEQSRNTRRSRIVKAFGEHLTVAEWAEKTGICYKTIWSRITDYGWGAERAVSP